MDRDDPARRLPRTVLHRDGAGLGTGLGAAMGDRVLHGTPPMTPETLRRHRHLDSSLPAWAHSLSPRTKAGLVNEQGGGGHFTPDEVKAIGRAAWLRVPNMGRRSVGELFDHIDRLTRAPVWPPRLRP